MSARHASFLVGALAALMIGAVSAQGGNTCTACGVITSIIPVSERQEWTPLGATSPGVMGPAGLSGTTGVTTALSLGRGGASKGLVTLGAAGGAVYGPRPSDYQRQRWDVTIKMDVGPPRVVSMKNEPLLVQEGDRVRIAGNNVELVNP
ncbi:MAG: hypothetical protein ABI777_03685 [Betaproteobacteria bacterium]